MTMQTVGDQLAPQKRITVQLVQNVVARYHSMSRQQLLERTRRHPIARPRQVAMYLSCKLTDASLPDIGARFGGFDHTTVMYGRDRIAELIELPENAKLKSDVDALAELLQSGKAGEWLNPGK